MEYLSHVDNLFQNDEILFGFFKKIKDKIKRMSIF